MASTADPFEAFREKRQVERLEQKFRSSATVRCPTPAEVGAESGAVKTTKASSPAKRAFDESRAWIY